MGKEGKKENWLLVKKRMRWRNRMEALAFSRNEKSECKNRPLDG